MTNKLLIILITIIFFGMLLVLYFVTRGGSLEFTGKSQTFNTFLNQDGSDNSTPDYLIKISNGKLVPDKVTIIEGTRIVWINEDKSNYRIVADGGMFSVAELNPGGNSSFHFLNPGTYNYKITELADSDAIIVVMSNSE